MIAASYELLVTRGDELGAFLDRLTDVDDARWLVAGNATASADRAGFAFGRVQPVRFAHALDAWAAHEDVATIAWYRFAGRAGGHFRREEREAIDRAIAAAQAIAAALSGGNGSRNLHGTDAFLYAIFMG